MSSSHSGDVVFEQANYYFINCILKQHDESLALEEVSKLRERNPSSPIWDDIDFLFGSYCFYSNQYSQASTWFIDLVNNHPDSMYHAEGLLYQMWLSFLSHDDRMVEQFFTTLTTNYPNSPKVATGWNEKARFQLQRENYDQAIQIYNYVLANYTQYKWAIADAHKGLGEAYLNQFNFSKALIQYQLITSLNINSKWNVIAEIFTGYTYSVEKDYPNAILQYQHIISNYPDQPTYQAQAQYRIGECYYRQRLYDDALNSFQRVLTQYPSSQWTAPANDKINSIKAVLGQQP